MRGAPACAACRRPRPAPTPPALCRRRRAGYRSSCTRAAQQCAPAADRRLILVRCPSALGSAYTECYATEDVSFICVGRSRPTATRNIDAYCAEEESDAAPARTSAPAAGTSAEPARAAAPAAAAPAAAAPAAAAPAAAAPAPAPKPKPAPPARQTSGADVIGLVSDAAPADDDDDDSDAGSDGGDVPDLLSLPSSVPEGEASSAPASGSGSGGAPRDSGRNAGPGAGATTIAGLLAGTAGLLLAGRAAG